MRLYELKSLPFTPEASYPGNIGIMEIIKFNQIASQDEKKLFKRLVALGQTKQAWDLIQAVTGVRLHGKEFA